MASPLCPICGTPETPERITIRGNQFRAIVRPAPPQVPVSCRSKITGRDRLTSYMPARGYCVWDATLPLVLTDLLTTTLDDLGRERNE
jgi:hypothetical protein